ncbi:hypothetical protein ACYZUD_11540 [Pseudomonas sp. XS1P51]
MNRRDYLAQTSVQHFIEWLSAHLDNATFKHDYLNRLRRTQWSCDSLFDAYRNYHWAHPAISRLKVPSGSTAASNDAALQALKADLERALKTPSQDQAVCQATIDVMLWGGVQAHNVSWLNTNRQGLAAVLAASRDAIDGGCPNVAQLSAPDLRFNAGMTKVYSLICRHFVIYDSRVAAALGWAVVMYCKENGLATVPPELAFPWAPAKEAGAVTAKRRNPSEGTLVFPRLKAGPHHAKWNMKASWVLRAALDHPNAINSGFKSGDGCMIDSLRQLEAALFMIGYDLGSTANEEQYMPTPRETDPDWIDCFTAARRIPFRYQLTVKEFVVENGPRFPIAVVNEMLENLKQVFGSSPFPLANKADDVRNEVSAEGIGTAYFRATAKRGNAPDTSKLSAILEDLGIFSLTQGSKRWMLNSDLLPSGPDGKIDIGPVVQRAMDEESVS